MKHPVLKPGKTSRPKITQGNTRRN